MLGMIAAVLLIVALGGAFLFGLFVYPIWMLVDCAISKSRSTKSKVIWIILLILIWPLASYAYGLFASGKKLFKWISAAFIALSILMFMLFLFAFSALNKEYASVIKSALARLDATEIKATSAEAQRELTDTLLVLDKDIKAGINKIRKISKVYTLLKMFKIISADNEITAAEHADWMNKFKSRDLLEDDSLRKYVESLKKNRTQSGE